MSRVLRRRRQGAAEEAASKPLEPDLRDDGGIRAVYRAHGPELYRFALRQLGDETAAQDVVQEVFLRAWRAADRFDPALASLRVWLFAIARNVLIDELRRAAKRPVPMAPSENGHPAGRPVGLGFDDRVTQSRLVEEALQRIGPEHRAVLV